MSKHDPKADDIRKANQKISRPEEAESPSAGRTGRLLRMGIPPAVAGTVVSAEDSETEEALRHASERNDKGSADR